MENKRYEFSTLANPIYTFTVSGIDSIRLVANNGSCADSTKIAITVNHIAICSGEYNGYGDSYNGQTGITV